MKQFQRVASLSPGRSVFDLSYEKKMTCDMGQLIPIMCDEVVPGDFFQIGNQAVVRFQPLVAPVLHEVNMYVHYFFIPDRLMWDEWEDFITGGMDGTLTPTLPTWNPTLTTEGSLWDYMGFPTGIVPTGTLPVDFPRRAYNMVYNEYYRDEQLTTEVALTNETILNRAWEKDYFTSSLPWPQRGVSPALPISGHSHALWPDAGGTSGGSVSYSTTYAPLTAGAKSALENNTVDLSVATPFDIAEFRLAFQMQKFLERNQRAGARYVEFLKAHFDVSPNDERLQRPEYIGGSKAPVIFSEVLQTSSTDGTSAQGNLAGHGISVSNQYCGKYHAEEFGVILGIMSIMPRSAYSQGVDRQWIKSTKYDYYFREFANLTEQAIYNAEICARNADATHNTGVFAYQGRYDEMRVKKNQICGELRTTYDYWHLGRQFNPASPPTLSSAFVVSDPRKDIFAVPAEPGLIVNFANIIKAARPLPISAEPGLVDHF